MGRYGADLTFLRPFFTFRPGGTNTITPMQDALMDGTPLVVLTGQVPRIMQVR